MDVGQGCQGTATLERLQERGAFEDSRHARVRPSFSQPRLCDPCARPSEVGYKWAVPIKACHPCINGLSGATHACHVPTYPRTHVPTYRTRVPRHLGCFCLAGRSLAGSGGSVTHANSLDQRWVPIQLTLVCLSPEVPRFLLLDDLPPRQPPPPAPFLLVCSPGRRPPSVPPASSAAGSQ